MRLKSRPDKTYLFVTVIRMDEPQYARMGIEGWFCRPAAILAGLGETALEGLRLGSSNWERSRFSSLMVKEGGACRRAVELMRGVGYDNFMIGAADGVSAWDPDNGQWRRTRSRRWGKRDGERGGDSSGRRRQKRRWEGRSDSRMQDISCR